MTLPDGASTVVQFNPSLTVDAVFSVTIGADQYSSRLNLRDHPALGPWVLSILDFVLHQQGRLPEARPIAEPPVGQTRQRLIDGRVIFAERRPDGGLALQLNPEFNLQLQVYTRRYGERAHMALLPLAEDADLSRWLLTHYPAPAADDALPQGTLAVGLRRHGVLVDRLPAEEAWFPDPGQPVDLVAELAPASRVFSQRAGQPIPPDVRQGIGRHTPVLPPGVDLLWSEDAGTGLVFPTRWMQGPDQPDPATTAGTGAAARTTFWDRQREVARLSLRTRRYAELREILPPAQRDKFRRYVRQLSERGYFPALGDGQVELRAALHNQASVAALHNGLAGIVNSISDEPVIASYCYLSCYEEGAVLPRHKDRKQCAYNLSLVLDMQNDRGSPAPWPIYLELDGEPESVELQVGDGLCYSGTDIWHWREALPPGQRAIVCFYHFVPRDFAGSLD